MITSIETSKVIGLVQLAKAEINGAMGFDWINFDDMKAVCKIFAEHGVSSTNRLNDDVEYDDIVAQLKLRFDDLYNY